MVERGYPETLQKRSIGTTLTIPQENYGMPVWMRLSKKSKKHNKKGKTMIFLFFLFCGKLHIKYVNKNKKIGEKEREE